ncbi:MAG: hypothetical protein WCI74_09175, partial [Actinomycetes bacterium]
MRTIDPSLTLRPSDGDPRTLLVLRCLRPLSFVLLWIGLIIAIANNRFDAQLADQLRTPGALVGSLTTPLAGVALALVLRAAVGIVAFLLAVPLASAHLE